MPPLSFAEFLEWRREKADIGKPELSQNRLLPLFNNFLGKGGFHAIVAEDSEEQIKDIFSTALFFMYSLKDLPQEFGIKDIQLLRTLVEMVAESPSMLLNYDSLARALGRSRITIELCPLPRVLAALQYTIANYMHGFRSSSRELRKLYLNNVSIAHAAQSGNRVKTHAPPMDYD